MKLWQQNIGEAELNLSIMYLTMINNALILVFVYSLNYRF